MMTVHRSQLAIRLAVAASLTLGGCSSGANSPSTLPQTPSTLARMSSTAVSGFAHPAVRPLPGATTSVIYIADAYSNAVYIYPPTGFRPSPIGSITQGVSGPIAIAVDKKGTLYVANSTADTVTVYPAGQTSPSLTLHQDITAPGAVAVDGARNVWVSNQFGSQGSVVEFAPGKTKPKKIITDVGQNPLGIAVDSQDNLYLGTNNGTIAYVAVYPPGASHPSTIFGGNDLIQPQAITVGPTGDVYVGDLQQSEVFIYSSGSYNLLQKFFVPQGNIGGLAIARNKRLYIADSENQDNVTEVTQYGFGKIITDSYRPPQSAFGVAADPIVRPGP